MLVLHSFLFLLVISHTCSCSAARGAGKATRQAEKEAMRILVVLSLTANDSSQTVATDLVETEQQQMLLRAPVAAWDRGQEILPAAYLAAEEINERSDVLSGRVLEIVPVNSFLIHSVSMAPSITTWATCIPRGPNSRAMD